jgi:hypothetical protein
MIHKMHKNYWAKFKNITIKIDLLVVVNDLWDLLKQNE